MLVAERDAGVIGGRTGGKLSQGIQLSIIRNSPLIAAAVGGALAAGAPLVTAGAVTMFAGAAAVAAAQSAEVRESWVQLGRTIRDSAVADAGVLVPTYVRMADRIGQAFQQLRPQIRDAFAAAGPGVDDFTDGVIRAAHEAMPALVRSVQQSGPVMAGLEELLADTGAGLGGFFDAISNHSPAAGAALASIGDIVGELLPLTGNLLGQGAELASVVLPPLADALGVTADVAERLGPALPAIVVGFTALKVASSVAGGVGNLASRLGGFVAASDLAGGASGKLATGLGAVSRAVPIVGTVAGVTAVSLGYLWHQLANVGEATTDLAGFQARLQAALQQSTGAVDENVRALAAQQAADQMISSKTNLVDYARQAGVELPQLTDALLGNRDVIRDVNAALDAQLEASVRAATARGEDAGTIAEWTQANERAKDAIAELSPALAQAASENERLEAATRLSTSALAEQALQSLAAGNADLQYRQATLGVTQAQERLAEVQASGKASATELQQAQLQVEQAMYMAAAAADAKARADNAGKSEAELNRLGAQAQLATLEQLAGTMGGKVPAAIQQQIASLQASAGQAAMTAATMDELAFSVIGIPNEKFVDVKAPTGPQMEALRQLGVRIETLPDGNVRVYADVRTAEQQINALINHRRTIMINTAIANGASTSVAMGRPTERASGGPVWPGHTFLVGEEGPELVRFSQPGTVFDAKRTASMLAQAGNAHAAAMLPPTAAPRSARQASGATGGAVVGSGGATYITNRNYTHNAITNQAITPREMIALQREADALYG